MKQKTKNWLVFGAALPIGVGAYLGLGSAIGLFDIRKDIIPPALVCFRNPRHNVEIIVDEGVDREALMKSVGIVQQRFRDSAGIELVLQDLRPVNADCESFPESGCISGPSFIPGYSVDNTTTIAATNRDYRTVGYNESGACWAGIRKIFVDTLDKRPVDENALLIQHELSHVFGLKNKDGEWNNPQILYGNVMSPPTIWGPEWTFEDIETMTEKCRRLELMNDD